MTTLSQLVTPHLPFISACIIGGPASSTYLPTVYASASPENRSHLDTFLALNDKGLKIKTLDGPEEGAKALKMGYAGLGKGLTGLGMAMVLCQSTRARGNVRSGEARRAHSVCLVGLSLVNVSDARLLALDLCCSAGGAVAVESDDAWRAEQADR